MGVFWFALGFLVGGIVVLCIRLRNCCPHKNGDNSRKRLSDDSSNMEQSEARRFLAAYKNDSRDPRKKLCPICFEDHNLDTTKNHYRSVVVRNTRCGFGFSTDVVIGPSGEYWIVVTDVFDMRLDMFPGDLIRSVNGKKAQPDNPAPSLLKELYKKTGKDRVVAVDVEFTHELGPIMARCFGFYSGSKSMFK
ncbi:uncharacterized protein LOC129599961 [Paramacrobiotus metropolitanus]|uniref:uncharacterized protein LOC129599961 n=1 Tax=Paramacrobiotus metropolitanus TaxID=2943436 RepID=UPI00244611B2|nr:uncharacterized protein LOC129599961 [Paramacrobiotus metropolitanus]